MAVLHVRSVPDDLYDALKRRAQAEGRSLSAEVVLLLHAAIQAPPRTQAEVVASIAQRRRFNPAAVGAPSTTALLRQDRQR